MRRPELAELANWIEMRFDPARGPGGQNVNKVATRATLLFDFRGCPLFSDDVRQRIAERSKSRVTRDGRLRVVAQRERTQGGNRAAAEARLLDLIAECLVVPVHRRATRPTAGSRRRRLAAKQRRSELKTGRVRPTLGE